MNRSGFGSGPMAAYRVQLSAVFLRPGSFLQIANFIESVTSLTSWATTSF